MNYHHRRLEKPDHSNPERWKIKFQQTSLVFGFFPALLPSSTIDLIPKGDYFGQSASPWFTIGFSLAAGIIIIFIVYILLLRKSIRDKTNSLQENEEKYRRFFMTSKDPVFITTRDGKWVDANQATIDLFGYDSKKDLFDTSVSQAYLNPHERSALLQDVVHSGFIKDLPVEMVDRRGNILHTLLTTTAITNSGGEVTGFQGTIRDNTSWIEAGKKMDENRETLELAVTGTGAGLWDWDLKTNLIMINDRFADMIGYRKSELSPLTIDIWEKLSHPGDLEQSNKLILKHFAGDLYHFQTEIRMKHKSGHWVWVLNQGRVVERNPDRSPIRMVGTTQDISERVLIREDIQSFADQLEALHVVTKSLSSTLSLKDLLDLVLEKLEETLSFDSASIFLLEDGVLRIETVHNHPHPELVVGKTFPTDNQLFQEIKTKKKSIIIDNAMRDSRFQGWGEMYHVKGWMGIPLIIQDNFIGYITMDSRKQSAFGSQEAKLANLFASQAAQAIHNARLYEQLSIHASSLESNIQERTKELTKMVDHMAGREIRMAELKDVIDKLHQQLKDHGIEPSVQDPLKDLDYFNL
ncbi:MAG TPA: PAS domain S-box protein [Chloroflexi bacterium]|nr:PAS domain S-box protein [Chloroflexota bacterium]